MSDPKSDLGRPSGTGRQAWWMIAFRVLLIVFVIAWNGVGVAWILTTWPRVLTATAPFAPAAAAVGLAFFFGAYWRLSQRYRSVRQRRILIVGLVFAPYAIYVPVFLFLPRWWLPAGAIFGGTFLGSLFVFPFWQLADDDSLLEPEVAAAQSRFRRWALAGAGVCAATLGVVLGLHLLGASGGALGAIATFGVAAAYGCVFLMMRARRRVRREIRSARHR